MIDPNAAQMATDRVYEILVKHYGGEFALRWLTWTSVPVVRPTNLKEILESPPAEFIEMTDEAFQHNEKLRREWLGLPKPR